MNKTELLPDRPGIPPMAKLPDPEEVRYYPNGKIELRQNFNHGLLDGKYERYNEAGAPVEKGSFANGEKEGKWTWYDNGKEVYRAKFKGGQEVK